MAESSKIEWTDATWNPITGCTVVSAGCSGCYAMKLAGGRMKNHWSREGLTKPGPKGPVWNGKLRFNGEWLDQPLRWRRPRMIFVCAHGDLFHENAPTEWINRVFLVMADAPQHTFQVLTKRPERMHEILTRCWNKPPLPNVWLGVSAENQETVESRIPYLLETPAAVRFLSAEPLLGPINLCPLHTVDYKYGEELASIYALRGTAAYQVPSSHYWQDHPKLDQVIVGGESGPNARPMHPNWARSLRDQCTAAGVPFFFKQWGEWAPQPAKRIYASDDPARRRLWFYAKQHKRFDDETTVFHVGKKRAGRLLDGRTWDEIPGEIAA